MGGNALDSAAVRKLEKLPTKTQMITSVAIMIKKVRIACYAHILAILCLILGLLIGTI